MFVMLSLGYMLGRMDGRMLLGDLTRQGGLYIYIPTWRSYSRNGETNFHCVCVEQSCFSPKHASDNENL